MQTNKHLLAEDLRAEETYKSLCTDYLRSQEKSEMKEKPGIIHDVK